MSNQKMQYDEKRFFVPENHPHHKELVTITKNHPFTILKTGFDYYDIPFYFDDGDIVIGEGDKKTIIAPEDYSQWYDNFPHTFDDGKFMQDNIIPLFNTLINQVAESRVRRTVDTALDAYRRLSNLERVLITYDGYDEAHTYEKIWETFQDIKILTSYLPGVSTSTYQQPIWLDYQVTINHKWRENEQYSFYINELDDMIELFEALRTRLFQYEYSKSNTNPALKYILEECEELAKLYTCDLNISLNKNSAKLLSVRQGSIEYAKYHLFTEDNSECGIGELTSDIKRCALRKYNKDTKKINKLAYDTFDAITKVLRTL